MKPDKDQIVDTMMGFFKAKTITSALELRLFDTLVDGPATAEEICHRAGVPAESGKRLVIALTALDLLEKDGDSYSLTAPARSYLVSSSPDWLGWLARHIDVFLYPLWGHAAEAVRQNKDMRAAVFNDDRSWFDILYENPKDVADFQEFLGIFARPFIEGLIQDFDFSQYKRFVDIGSGIGTLPVAVAKRYPDLEVAVCELPGAVQLITEKLSETEPGRRVKVLEGNVIEGTIPREEFDLIHLGWMLHDYGTDLQMQILKNVFDALPPGGGFIASETPLNNDESGPLFTALLSINMLVSTDGGIESTSQQYVERFEKAGFVNVRPLHIPGPRTLFFGEKPQA